MQTSFLEPVQDNQTNMFSIMRDQYYSYLMKKYNCDDYEIIDHLITDAENEIREDLELKAMGRRV